MKSLISTFGTEIAASLRPASPGNAIETKELRTVQDVLSAIEAERPEEPIAMLRTAAGHLATCVGVPVSALTIEVAKQSLPDFGQYLSERKYEKATVRAYRYHANSLPRLASDLGWIHRQTEAERAWSEVLALLALPPGCPGIARFAIDHDVSPLQLSDVDLTQFVQLMIERGRGAAYAKQRLGHFRRAVVRAHVEGSFPGITLENKLSRFGIAVEKMPEPLRTEVNALLRFKQADYAPGRPRHGKIRAVTACGLKSCISRLYGFAVKHLKREGISVLMDLVTEEIVGSYIEWAINDNHLKPSSFGTFRGLKAAVTQNPAYKKLDFGWFTQLLANIPVELESSQRDRKALKYLPYDTLSEIPKKLSQLRSRWKKGNQRYALLMHDELIIRWLLVLPWRQRNIREARLGTPQTDNIFKSGFAALVNIAKPRWVEDELSRDPKATFWQVYFREPETKTGQEIRGVLPKQLIPLLEEYLQSCRPVLVHANDPGTVFLNRNGGALTEPETRSLVGDITARHAGRRVTPHLFRDSFAHAWLDAHPEDYLTLSKVLWHRSINTTIRIYGRNYDESYGIRKTEEWLDNG